MEAGAVSVRLHHGGPQDAKAKAAANQSVAGSCRNIPHFEWRLMNFILKIVPQIAC